MNSIVGNSIVWDFHVSLPSTHKFSLSFSLFYLSFSQNLSPSCLSSHCHLQITLHSCPAAETLDLQLHPDDPVMI